MYDAYQPYVCIVGDSVTGIVTAGLKLVQPVYQIFKDSRTDRLLDRNVFRRQARSTFLKQVIQSRVDFHAGFLVLGQIGLNCLHIGLGKDLQIFFSVHDKDGAGGLAYVRSGIIVQKEVKPRGGVAFQIIPQLLFCKRIFLT